jgi:branched-chain amino acid transport system permease protein
VGGPEIAARTPATLPNAPGARPGSPPSRRTGGLAGPVHEFVPGRGNWPVWLPVLAAAAAFPLVVTSEYLLNIGVLAGIYVVLASSLNITNGYTGLFSFGHAAFYGIGAYTAAILATRAGLPFWLTLPLAGVVAGAVGAAIALPALRLKGIFLALVTIGFQEIWYLVTMNWIALTRGPMGIPGIPPASILGVEVQGNRGYFYLVLALDVVVIFVISRVATSRVGRALVAMREDELAASASGVSPVRFKVLAFALATFFAGVAGGFFAHHARFVSADSFRLDETFVILTMLIVGGMGSIVGPVAGAVFLVILPEASRVLAEYRGVVYGVILIGVILFRPHGIAGVPGLIQPRGAAPPPERAEPEAAADDEAAAEAGAAAPERDPA